MCVSVCGLDQKRHRGQSQETLSPGPSRLRPSVWTNLAMVPGRIPQRLERRGNTPVDSGGIFAASRRSDFWVCCSRICSVTENHSRNCLPHSPQEYRFPSAVPLNLIGGFAFTARSLEVEITTGTEGGICTAGIKMRLRVMFLFAVTARSGLPRTACIAGLNCGAPDCDSSRRFIPRSAPKTQAGTRISVPSGRRSA